jgi:dCTP deaminase
MAILTGEAIKQEIALGNIHITPYEEKNVQPASVDLTLGSGVCVYIDGGSEWQLGAGPGYRIPQPALLDPKKKNATRSFVIGAGGLELYPGTLYLMHTLERIHTDKYVSVLDGKSSIGRLGVVVHLTAGYGDPGFDGQYTLEVSCIHPVVLYAGMKIAQMRFHLMHGPLDMSYTTRGHYIGDKAQGAIPSMAYKQFGEDNG